MIWRLGVAGSPIQHSLSPQVQEAGLRLAGLEGTSTRLEIGVGEVQRLATLLASSYDALSVTMPLKRVATGLCDQLDVVATRLGVVNTLLARDGQVFGANFDGAGFVDSLRGEFSADVEGMHAVVLGAGGAALGIVDALVHSGARSVRILSRTASRVDELCSHYESVTVYAPSSEHVDLVVNTTPSTTRLDTTVLPGVAPSTLAVDITYEPRRSPWLKQHERLGCPSANGLAMLAYQAALQMQWWWNVPVDAKKLLEVIQ